MSQEENMITLVPTPFAEGYNSHGCWTSFREIAELEQERENEPFIDWSTAEIDQMDDYQAIWVTRKQEEAFRYVITASEWEEPWNMIEERYPDWKQEVETICCHDTWIVGGADDGDGGYLIVRKE